MSFESARALSGLELLASKKKVCLCTFGAGFGFTDNQYPGFLLPLFPAALQQDPLMSSQFDRS
jgi:hypothetical protein